MTRPVALVRFDPARTLADVSPRICGHFSEHLHNIIYDGVWAELLKNRKFELPSVHGRIERVAPGWSPSGLGADLLRGSRGLVLGLVVTRTTSRSCGSPWVGYPEPVESRKGMLR